LVKDRASPASLDSGVGSEREYSEGPAAHQQLMLHAAGGEYISDKETSNYVLKAEEIFSLFCELGLFDNMHSACELSIKEIKSRSQISLAV
jgi:hypothetical protein